MKKKLIFFNLRYVILFSIERFIVVQFPLKKYDICNQSRNKLSVGFLLIFSLFFYSYTYFSSHVENRMCTVKFAWLHVVKLMSLIDVFVTIFIPFIIILFTNISIYCKLMKKLNLGHAINRSRKNDELSTDASYVCMKVDDKSKMEHSDAIASINTILLSGRRKTVSSTRERVMGPNLDIRKQVSYPELSSFNELKNEYCETNIKVPIHKKPNFILFRKITAFTSLLRQSAELKRAKMYSKTTRMLIIISITFILLNTPMAFSRIHSVIISSLESFSGEDIFNNSTNSSVQMEDYAHLNYQLIERFSGYFYYLNFSVNFFLYVINGSQFREILFKFTKGKK